MPTYEYRCRTCGVQFDVRQSISENSLTNCPGAESPYSPPACEAPGEGEISKVFFAPSIAFKGAGFYKTDSRSAAASTGKESSNGKGPSSGSGKEGATKDKGSKAAGESSAPKDASAGKDKAAAGASSGASG